MMKKVPAGMMKNMSTSKGKPPVKKRWKISEERLLT